MLEQKKVRMFFCASLGSLCRHQKLRHPFDFIWLSRLTFRTEGIGIFAFCVSAIADLGSVTGVFAATRAKNFILQPAMTMNVLAFSRPFFAGITRDIFAFFS